MPGTIPIRTKRPQRPQRPMKRCPDGSRRMINQPCPPRPARRLANEMRGPLPKGGPISRAEQFKRERLGK